MTRMSRLGSDDSDEPNRLSPIGRAGLGPGRMLLAPPTFPAHSRRQARRRRRRRRHCRRRRLRAGPGAALPSIRRPGRVRCWAAVPSALRGHGAGATMYCHNADNSPPSRRVGPLSDAGAMTRSARGRQPSSGLCAWSRPRRWTACVRRWSLPLYPAVGFQPGCKLERSPPPFLSWSGPRRFPVCMKD
jgi:hypothetical protein